MTIFNGSVAKISVGQAWPNAGRHYAASAVNCCLSECGAVDLKLQLSHHLNELNTSQSDAGGGFGLEAEYASYPPFDSVMILLDGVVHVFTGADGDWLSTISQPILSIALRDGCPIGLTAVDSNLIWPAMLGQCFCG